MEQQSNAILTTCNLNIGYGTKGDKHSIVDSITISLKKGTLTGLIGINGSGKSTLLRTLAGLQAPLSGQVKLNTKFLSQTNPIEIAKNISVVLTHQNISKNLEVYELVALGRQPYTNWLGALSQNDVDIVTKALHQTDTFTLKNKKCFELSDGQLQRVLIARALAQNTEVILLDEPMTHLDLHHKAALLKLLATIAHEQQKAILFSTHDIEHAIQLCDSLIVIQNNKAIIDSPENLIKSGIFKTLFPSNHLKFNSVHKRFELE